MIARKSLLIVTSQFLASIVGWVGLVILAKLWGSFAPEALGIIGFAMSFLALFNIIADLGFSRAHVKRISEGKDLGTCIGTYAAIKLVLTGLMVTVVFVAIFIWKNVFYGNFYDATTESVVIVFIFYYIFSNLRQIATVTFEGRREIAKRQITELSGSSKILFTILVVLAGVKIAGISPAIDWPRFLQPLQQFLATYAVGSLAMTYVFAMMATFFVGMWFLRTYPLKKPSWELFKNYFSFALPIMLFSVIGVISLNIDKIMIGYFWTSTEVGYYFTVQRILQMILVLSTSVGIVLFPTISEYHSSKHFERINKTTRMAERYISMVMIPPIVVIIVLAHPLINIMLSGAFIPAASVLVTLAIYTFIFSLNRPFGALIGGLNRPDIAVKIGFVMCLTNIILNYLFIPEGGLLSTFGINGPTGAATATVLSVLVGFFGQRLAAKKLTGIKFLQNHTPRHIIAGLVMGGVVYYFSTLIQGIHWYHLLGFAGVGLGVYLGILLVMKEFKKEDLNFFLDILHPREMFKYVSSELKERPKKPN